MPLIDRLILGTARLAGGASEQEALAIVATALDAGVRHIDTAPSYGLGTAETIVGKALARFGDGGVAVTAKLGSARPGQRFARSVLRRAKRTFGGSRRALRDYGAPPPERILQPVGNDFAPEAMARSFAVSQAALGRIDFLLLHDITIAEATAEVVGALTSMAESAGASPGHASLAQFDPDLAARFPAGAVTQCAISPDLLLGAAPSPAVAPLFFHSLVHVADWYRTTDPKFAATLDGAARIVGGESAAARIAAVVGLAARRAPAARLLIASSHRDRIATVLAAIARIDREGLADELAAMFAPQVG